MGQVISWEQELRMDLDAARSLRAGSDPVLFGRLISHVIVGVARVQGLGREGTDREELIRDGERFIAERVWSPTLKQSVRNTVEEVVTDCRYKVEEFYRGLESMSDEDLSPLASEIIFLRDWLGRLHGWALDSGIKNIGLDEGDDFDFDSKIRSILPDIDRLLGSLRSSFATSDNAPWVWWERQGCLTDGRIAAYLSGAIQENIEFSKHLNSCSICASKVETMDLPSLPKLAFNGVVHPTQKRLKEYLALNLATTEWNLVDEHIRKCKDCSTVIEQLRDEKIIPVIITLLIDKIEGLRSLLKPPSESFGPSYNYLILSDKLITASSYKESENIKRYNRKEIWNDELGKAWINVEDDLLILHVYLTYPSKLICNIFSAEKDLGPQNILKLTQDRYRVEFQVTPFINFPIKISLGINGNMREVVILDEK